MVGSLAATLPIPSSVWIARWKPLLQKISALEPELQKLSDSDIRKRSLALRYRARSGEPLSRLLVEAYALVREAGRRKLNMRHFDVQILGGIAMFHHAIVEMQTGEGKTLTATLPMYLYALAGRGCHLATVNDYLAKRDAEWMGPIYELLGLTVGVIQTQMSQNERRKAYAADVTYGTAKEFGFDFLRDRLLLRRIREGQTDVIGAMLGDNGTESGEKPVQREPFFALVDEADSILIDEARTPLIISALPTEEEKLAVECYKWAAKVADQFIEDVDYEYDHEKKTVELTREGRRKARALPKPEVMASVGMFHIYEYIERAIKVARDFIRDREYVVKDGEIVIVDEFTGRLAEGRKWRDGIHQAVEAKEGVEVTVATGQAARITIQDFFLRYRHLAGMTGTARDSAWELRKIYKCPVIVIPTNRPVIRKRLPDLVFGTQEAKWQAVVDEICEMHAQGRPVLVGTRSIDKSEYLSRLLTERGIEHQVLNAHHIEEEAKIVAQAGQKGRVTVSTNMAGRGTDIRLGPGVAELGGLHVICTEMHDAARIDWQLRGRCGRQGDPGTFRQFLALDDELLLKAFGAKKAKKYAEIGKSRPGLFNEYAPIFRKAQKIIERRHFRERRALMHFERERKKMQRQMGQDPYLDTPG
ncbi:Protein export cytoplasm protein SecA ATPase RNA helicase [Thermogutta terrifontis]|uniref:Protein translocase subunit SecA n=1 Tax=Thermogutta terrifontis TaxID=1331910 RepID=A0A286RG38_9BACT|nr:preprotein translocase subunit SecA [Thermogutta terrifontis]ASV74917.1 Protein export cytoplasm protein SecA ATPase RNA helicase [Thermogutta terrifontis]